ncbi:hypothetical protein Pla110_01680 [Polystyrenella longa]|uniref:Alpha/beta hydrolase family protein n=1 Tax=Polystyrenella longa TaxID=2528007 RepID=A0A518CH16_9PLAN|nr:alpha/beta hydrolase [Polystyrenella longa]QDU78464.1 hypothetical protein Pla110_01680 [Polystyrenella longa]
MAHVPSIFQTLLMMALLFGCSPLVMGQSNGPTLLPPSISAPVPENPTSSVTPTVPLPQYNPAASEDAPTPTFIKGTEEAAPDILVTPRIQIPSYRPTPTTGNPSQQPRTTSPPQINNRVLKPTTPRTYGQPGSPAPRIQADPLPPQQAPAPTTRLNASSTGPAKEAEGGTWREADYWIVSSRSLPQSPREEWKLNGQPPMLDYVHFDRDRTFRRYPREKYEEWFKPGTPVCIMVHGSFTSWESLRFESGHLYHWLKKSADEEPLQIVFFTWPSSSQLTGLLVTDVERLGSRSSYNARYLQDAVLSLPEKSPVTLLGHSHGARMCAQTLHDLDHSQKWKDRQDQADIQAIFIAAAFDHFWLQPGQRNDRVVHVTDRILNMKNSNDLALAFYSVQGSTGAEPLGRVGFTPQDRSFIGPSMTKIKEFDLAPFIGTAHLWSSFYQRADVGKYVTDFVFLPTTEPASSESERTDSPQNVASPDPLLRSQITDVMRPQSGPVQVTPSRTTPIQSHPGSYPAARSRMQPFAAGLPLIRGRRPIPPTAAPHLPRKW